MSASERQGWLQAIAASAPPFGRVEYLGNQGFGRLLQVARYRLANGLRVLVCEDHSAPVAAYHTWFQVGSRHERVGKTGLAHLFEHLMFNESEGVPYGEFDRRLEEAGAENNASTWLDWTHYTISAPASQLGMVVELEAGRMGRLVLRDKQVESEKEVVANERRYRVEDDVEGAASEQLWSTAFERHPYRWPTIGWMEDIQGFTTADCQEFYRTYYAPSNALLVVVGDVAEADVMRRVSAAYGHLPPAERPLEDSWPEPPQIRERRVELRKPTASEKLLVGYHGPALGDADHLATTVLGEILFGGRASRCYRALVRDSELAIDARVFVGQFRDPGLFEIFVSARPGCDADAILARLDLELTRICHEPVPAEELERNRARIELAQVASLETVDGKATTIGFYESVLGRPNAAFERLEELRTLTADDIRRAARRYLAVERRSVVIVRPTGEGEASDEIHDPEGP